VRINTRKSDYQHSTDFEIGKAEVVSSGTDVTLLVYGMLFDETLKAKAILEKEGLSVGLVNIRTLKPIDEKVILDIARKSELLVTIEDHFLIGGLYSILAETFLRNRMTAQVLPLSLTERWFKPALLQEVLNHEGFTGEKIAGKVIAELNKKPVSKA
jgi:transketolase